MGTTLTYFHDAAAKDLAEATRIMTDVQYGQELSKDEIAKIAAFMETLPGELEGKPLAPPKKRPRVYSPCKADRDQVLYAP